MFNDGVECILNATICAMREAFDPSSTYPPLGGGSTEVRVFAGDAIPTSYIDLHVATSNCSGDDCCQRDPFLWVRLVRRYRTQTFPQPYVGAAACATQRAVAVEVGVARCAVVEADGTDWDALANEAEIALDDSGRIELALCRASAIMQDKECSDLQAIDAIVPYGPDGGLIGWLGTLYAAVSK